MRFWASHPNTKDRLVHYLGCRISRGRQTMNYKRLHTLAKRLTGQPRREKMGRKVLKLHTRLQAHTHLGWLLLWAHSMPTLLLWAAPQLPPGPLPWEYTASYTLCSHQSSHQPPDTEPQALTFMLPGPFKTVRGKCAQERGRDLLREHSRTEPHKQLPNNKGVDAYGSCLHCYPAV